MTCLAPLAFIILIALAAPASTQTIDFGDDTSQWSSDGECDDPRFEGTGMTQTPILDTDIGRDATDCKNAFNAGRISLTEGFPSPVADALAPNTAETSTPAPATPDEPFFGTDTAEWANDGECDDRRFAGEGMAGVLSWTNVGQDATDCQTLFEAGSIRLWDFIKARGATHCSAIDFGDDASDYSKDGACDDKRFEGFSAASNIGPDAVGHDATDCSVACNFGTVAHRDY